MLNNYHIFCCLNDRYNIFIIVSSYGIFGQLSLFLETLCSLISHEKYSLLMQLSMIGAISTVYDWCNLVAVI